MRRSGGEEKRLRWSAGEEERSVRSGGEEERSVRSGGEGVRPGRSGRNDRIFIAVFAAVATAGLLVYAWRRPAPGAKVIVTVDGEVYGEYPLGQEREVPVEIDGVTTNIFVIQDGEADMTWADCPDRLCVQQKAISGENETIVCLPNRVVVQVTGGKESRLDTIAK